VVVRLPMEIQEIVAKRGTLKLTYPSNNQAKKMWDIVEGRFKVGYLRMAELCNTC
jgi:isocitrate lyase